LRHVTACLIATAVAAVLLSSCSRGGLQPIPDAELEILVVRGPINPVQREGEENAVPVVGARVLITQLQGREVARVETGPGGLVIAPVASGDYLLELTRCPSGTMFAKNQHVRVGPNERVPVTVTCDTGIR